MLQGRQAKGSLHNPDFLSHCPLLRLFELSPLKILRYVNPGLLRQRERPYPLSLRSHSPVVRLTRGEDAVCAAAQHAVQRKLPLHGSA